MAPAPRAALSADPRTALALDPRTALALDPRTALALDPRTALALDPRTALALDPRTALVLFSGGQDSSVCLAWALARYAKVETVGFDYGQRHRIELACRPVLRCALAAQFPDWAARLGADHVLDVGLLAQLSDSALTCDRAIAFQASGLPNTFVPGRNLLFLTLAAALAYRRGASVLVGGMCETDYSGYPDCRDNTLKAMQLALSLGLDCAMTVETPLMWLTKADTWALGQRLGGEALTALLVEHSHTCYLGERGQRHPWGHGCGACPACVLRARGWADWTGSGNAGASGGSALTGSGFA